MVGGGGGGNGSRLKDCEHALKQKTLNGRNCFYTIDCVYIIIYLNCVSSCFGALSPMLSFFIGWF